MKQYVGIKCKIHINRAGKDLYYEATISAVTETHISFTDKFNTPYTFRVSDVIEIRGIQDK
jgi:hypothetical protein